MQERTNILKIETEIIPVKQSYLGEKKNLDKEAICVFVATGFFLDQDTFYNELKALKPGFNYELNVSKTRIVSQSQYFKWHYSPVERSFEQIVTEFATLFETIIKEQVKGHKVILPLSGGIDSRTQAAALYYLGIPVQSYSYSFDGGHNESSYGEKIANLCKFPFTKYIVSSGYLWDSIDRLASINKCYTEFTHPRQMAFVDEYDKHGNVFSLGHWGDVLFDDMGVNDNLTLDEQVEILLKKMVVKGGMELASSLWDSWGLNGVFKDYLKLRIRNLLEDINIKENANAQIRAFKSLYWAPRWTSANLSIFEEACPISLPYYDNRMCEFICTVPEKYLSARQIQIAYLKMRMPALAKITWEAQRPFNLYNYHYNKLPWNLPYRIFNKLKRVLNAKMLIERNWELQFIGTKNEEQLKKRLFENDAFVSWIPVEITQHFYHLFKTEDAVYYSHPVSILLTLSLFSKNYLDRI